MYLEFYGFQEKPFTITPNPRFIYLSKNHREVFAHLLYGIKDRCGFVVVTGEVGTGKTTILRTLFDDLDETNYHLALIFNPCLSVPDLLRDIHRELGIETKGISTGELIHELNRFLLQQRQGGRTVVLVIDEAQSLNPSVLEQVRLLSNLETETEKLIQIVLVGQTELTEMLRRKNLRQLNQRIGVRYQLNAMDFHDTCEYVKHRLSVAGGDVEIFTPAALKKIYSFSRGLPRLINLLCGRALLLGYAQNKKVVTARMISTTLREIDLPRRGWFRLLLDRFCF